MSEALEAEIRALRKTCADQEAEIKYLRDAVQRYWVALDAVLRYDDPKTADGFIQRAVDQGGWRNCEGCGLSYPKNDPCRNPNCDYEGVEVKETEVCFGCEQYKPVGGVCMTKTCSNYLMSVTD